MNIDISDGKNMETKANESFDNGDFSISRKRTSSVITKRFSKQIEHVYNKK